MRPSQAVGQGYCHLKAWGGWGSASKMDHSGDVAFGRRPGLLASWAVWGSCIPQSELTHRETETESCPKDLYNLTSKMTYHHFCHILQSSRPTLRQGGRRLHKGTKAKRQWSWTGGHLGAWGLEKSSFIKTFLLTRAGGTAFPGSPVVRTPSFHCQGHGFNPWSGN